MSPGYEVNFPHNNWDRVDKLNLPLYSHYIEGRYFPSLEIKPDLEIHTHRFWGAEWGVYATENIDAHVFLGEYACDILSGKDLVVCKKSDAIFRHSGGSKMNDSYLAPKDFAGYITLVNTTQKKDCNCVPLRVIVGDCLRVLLVSSRAIRKGEQITYSYGCDYINRVKTVLE